MDWRRGCFLLLLGFAWIGRSAWLGYFPTPAVEARRRLLQNRPLLSLSPACPLFHFHPRWRAAFQHRPRLSWRLSHHSHPDADALRARPPTATATIKYLDGQRFTLFYDKVRAIPVQPGKFNISITSLDFGAPRRGWRNSEFLWRLGLAQNYATCWPPGVCASRSQAARPTCCLPTAATVISTGLVASRGTTNVFWTAQPNSRQFRVLWQKGGIVHWARASVIFTCPDRGGAK